MGLYQLFIAELPCVNIFLSGCFHLQSGRRPAGKVSHWESEERPRARAAKNNIGKQGKNIFDNRNNE